MENFRLKVFRTVADTLNFRQAAEALYLTQPAVTLQIKALEEELGVPLFDRTENRVALTEAGRILLKHAKKVETLTAVARQELARLVGEEEGDLSACASTTIAQYLLPKLIGQFRSLNPQIQRSLLGAKPEKIGSRVLESTEAIKSAVEAGVGVGFVSCRAIRKELKLDTLREVPISKLDIQRVFSIIYPRGPEPRGAAGVFLRFLREKRDHAASKRAG